MKYQAGAVEQRILHMQTADPLRTPTYTLFPVPDYFFSTTGPNVGDQHRASPGTTATTRPNIDVTWAGVVGPGVAANGRRRTAAGRRQRSRTTRTRRNTVPAGEHASAPGWRRSTCVRRCCTWPGCSDDYPSDGRVISQVLSSPSSALRATQALAAGLPADQLERR